MTKLDVAEKTEADLSIKILKEMDTNGKIIIKQNVIPFFVTYATTILGVLCLVVLLSIALFEIHVALLNILTIDGIALLIMFGILAFAALLSWFEVTKKYYLLTKGSIIIRKRLLQDNEDSYELKEFYEGSVHQSLLGRIFNYGDLYLNSRRIEEANIMLKNISDPHTIKTVIENIRYKYDRRSN